MIFTRLGRKSTIKFTYPLKGEKFLVKVEGMSKGFLVKDIEIASTSNIIEKKSNLGAHPGTDENFDKLLYTYLTKNNAYICIFLDKGKGGIPYQSQNQQTIGQMMKIDDLVDEKLN